jgi:hypothetical protein
VPSSSAAGASAGATSTTAGAKKKSVREESSPRAALNMSGHGTVDEFQEADIDDR